MTYGRDVCRLEDIPTLTLFPFPTGVATLVSESALNIRFNRSNDDDSWKMEARREAISIPAYTVVVSGRGPEPIKFTSKGDEQIKH